MLDLHDLPDTALMKLPLQVQAMIERLQQRIAQQGEELAHQQQQLGDKTLELSRKEREIAWRDARLEKIQFELARLKRWQFGAKSEAMNAEQRALFAETMLEDEADLKARLAKLQGQIKPMPPAPKPPARKPRRQALPEHLPREEHHHEPSDTHCPNDGCGRPMQRVGEDVSEKLDIVPAQFFVHRHIYGKWACRCCQTLTQEPAEPDVIDGGIPASGLVAHTLISRFVDHLPYYRQEDINARAGVHTPRSSLTAWSGAGGAALEPLRDVLKDFVLSAAVLHADETPIPLLDPGAGKTKKAYVWAYARGEFDPHPGVVYEFCPGRGGQYPLAFLGGSRPGRPHADPPWSGTLVTDQYAGYAPVLDPGLHPGRGSAGCGAHARRKFEELAPRHAAGAILSPVAQEALQRWAQIYHLERQFSTWSAEQRLEGRQRLSRPLWEEMRVWLELELRHVGGQAIRGAINYSLNHWAALTRHLDDGNVPIDNNLIERQIKPWKLGAKNWLFVGSELAGERAAIVMSLVQTAKLNKIDPWSYLRDVLARINSHPANRLEELLPHLWQPR